MSTLKHQALEHMLKDHKITDLRSLIELNDDELDALIGIIQLHDGKVNLKDILKDVSDEDEKIRILIDEISKKLCRCIKKVGGANPTFLEGQNIAVCIKSIFHSKGITIPRLQCFPEPTLIPKKGTNAVIKKHIVKSV